MPFGIIGRTGPGMRQVVGFGDRSTGRDTFWGEFGARRCNQWGLYGVRVRQRRDAALFPNLFGQTCYCCDISALNNSESSVQPLVGCNSSTNDVLIVVTVVMGTLLAVAMTALAVALYKIWQMKDRTASATQ